MKMKKSRILKDRFILYTMLVSLVLGVLYLMKGFKNGFPPFGCVIIAANFLYIPFALIFSKKGFPYFYLAYSGILIFSMATERTYLYNNYTALFIVCVIIMLQPKIRTFAIIFYFTAISIAFLFEEKDISNYFIHIARSLWYIGLIEYVLQDKFKRKKLVLYEDERKILDQLCNGKIYQKEVEGFSENTIYRKLKAARERNGNVTRDQLVESYRIEREKSEAEKEGI